MNEINPAVCPICGRPNGCSRIGENPGKGLCWCATKKFPLELLEKIPEDARGRACVCEQCLTDWTMRRRYFELMPESLRSGRE